MGYNGPAVDVLLTIEFFGWLMLLAGFVIGLVTVTAVDYSKASACCKGLWTETNARMKRFTNPLVWLWIGTAFIGCFVVFRDVPMEQIPTWLLFDAIVLLLNGAVAAYVIQPLVLQREYQSDQCQALPWTWRAVIIGSFLVSLLGWWSGLTLVLQQVFYR
jgi:hypothetical protein